MDNISLIGHMSGQGEVLTNKLRQADYATLQKIIEEEPSVLAESTGLEPDIISKIINSAKALSQTCPAPKIEAKAEEKVVQAAPPQEKEKEAEKPAEEPKEIIVEKPILDPLRRVAHEFATEREIVEGTAIRFVNAVKKSPGIREKVLKEVMTRDKFRERLARHLAKGLT